MNSSLINPFIQTLPAIHSYTEFESLAEIRPDKAENFYEKIHEDREGDLDELYVPNQLAWSVYKEISRLIRKGYRTRNPNDMSFIKHNHNWAFGHSEQFSEEFKEKKGIAGVITGHSGYGKTTLVDRMLSLIPKTRLHRFESTVVGSEFLQIVWIKVDCDADSRKETLLSIAKQIQSHVKHDLGIKKLDSLRAPALRKAVVSLCRQFAVGLVVVDECQTLTNLPFDKDDKTTSTEFLEKLYQDLGVPLLTIGTPKFRDLLEKRPETHRRMTKNLSLRLERYDEDDEFWPRLVEIYICNFVFPGSSVPSKKLNMKIYEISGGNIALLQKLCSEMLILRENSQVIKLTDEFLEQAYLRVKTDVETSKILLELNDVDSEEIKPKKPKMKQKLEGDDEADIAGERYRNKILKLRGKR